MDTGAASWVEGGDIFHFYYRGSSEVDKHYTKPMLPWIISEVKNRKQKDPVRVEVTKGLVIVKDTSGVVVVSHAVRQIHKCVMEQADHSCFLYTLRTSDKENSNIPGALGYVVALDPSQPQPANFLADQNYQCHLFQADSEQEVRDFFTCLRKQPREVQADGGNLGPCMASLPDLTVHNESQFFEVLFVGRVKVSHCKVPAAFIDEALEAFKTKERLKMRMNVGESRQRYPSGGSVIYGQDGSSLSVPSITFASLHTEDNGGSSNRSRSNSKEHVEVPKDPSELKQQQQHPKVRFILGSSMDDSEEDSPKKVHKEISSSSTSITTLSSVTGTTTLATAKSTSASTSTTAATASRTTMVSSAIGITTSSTTKSTNPASTIATTTSPSVQTSSSSISSSSSNTTLGSSNSTDTMSIELCNLKSNIDSIVSRSSKEVKEDSSDDTTGTLDNPQIQPRRQRLRTISGDSSHMFRKSHLSDTPMRARAGSIGSAPLRQRSLKAGELEGRMLGQDFNRTMLFHIGRSEIQLINPEIKSVQLNKPFQDVAQCCRGLKNDDHFGFICREMNGDASVYLGYVFRCQTSPVCDEIMQALSKSFAAVHEAQQREKQENLLCDQCPLRWFSQLCAEVEGLPATKAHMVVMKKISSLQEEERSLIIAKYEGAEVKDAQMQNNILMMLLRAHFESKQSTHAHTALPGGGVRPEYPTSSNFESSLRRAKKSLTSSFNQLLKRDGEKREGDSMEREVAVKEDTSNVNLSADKSPTPATPSKVRMEGLSDSPLGFHRPRSSTVGASGGDAMRREFLAKRAAAKHKPEPPKNQTNTTPKLNIFLKVGSPARHMPGNSEEEAEGSSTSRPPLSFRHAILQRVVSPPKAQAESIEQMGIRRTQTSSRDRQPQRSRSWEELKIIWKKAIFQQILLIRMERENRRLRALQQEEELQRVRLGYEEEDNVEEVEQAWMLMLSRPNSRIDVSIIQSGIVQGIPKSLRGQVWQMLVHQHKLQNSKCDPDLPAFHLPYEAMLKDLTSQHHAIIIDLGRTFPTHPYFSQTLGSGQLALFNLLKAYSLLDKEVGYCQGLSFVGGILLLHVDEETAYQLLKHLMYVMGCRKQYRTDLHGLQVEMYQLSRLLHDKLKQLYDHLECHEVIPQLYAAPWFLTLFASQFPISFVVRVFDLLFLEGMEAVFKVALVLLQTHEESLMHLDSFEHVMDYMKTQLPQVPLTDYGSFFAKVSECTITQELQAYEVEYHVLQEELALSPLNDQDIKKLQDANKNLKRQNLDLLEQLHQTNSLQHSLEVSNQNLQQNHHHLEVRARWLELERNNLRQLVNLLAARAETETLASVPANLQRFLPKAAGNDGSMKREVSPAPGLVSTAPRDRCENGSSEKIDISTELPSVDHMLSVSPRSFSLDQRLTQQYIRTFNEA